MKGAINLVFFLLLGTIAFYIGGCKSKEKNDATQEFIPLTEGNYWVYHNYYYRSPRKDSICDADSLRIHIGKKSKINNEDWYLWGIAGLNFENAGKNSDSGFCSVTTDEKGNFPAGRDCLFFKYPTKPGEVWFSKSLNDSIRTVSINTNVTVPAGTFKCIHYQPKSMYKYSNNGYYMAQGIGMIKCEIIGGIDNSYSIPDTVWNILKLTKYVIKK